MYRSDRIPVRGPTLYRAIPSNPESPRAGTTRHLVLPRGRGAASFPAQDEVMPRLQVQGRGTASSSDGRSAGK
ncbi:hypothetical protein GW17_00023111 [Ensete ventricosum]|nr:hypothetical protein GW17_00023111 [Ensete ventricosum]